MLAPSQNRDVIDGFLTNVLHTYTNSSTKTARILGYATEEAGVRRCRPGVRDVDVVGVDAWTAGVTQQGRD